MAGDGHERVVDLVGHAAQQLARRRETTLFLRPVAQHTRHLIEMVRDPAKLVVSNDRHLSGQVTVRDLLDPALQRGERLPHAAPHDEQDNR